MLFLAVAILAGSPCDVIYFKPAIIIITTAIIPIIALKRLSAVLSTVCSVSLPVVEQSTVPGLAVTAAPSHTACLGSAARATAEGTSSPYARKLTCSMAKEIKRLFILFII